VFTLIDDLQALSISLTVMTSGQVMNGLGRHISQLTADERIALLRVSVSTFYPH